MAKEYVSRDELFKVLGQIKKLIEEDRIGSKKVRAAVVKKIDSLEIRRSVQLGATGGVASSRRKELMSKILVEVRKQPGVTINELYLGFNEEYSRNYLKTTISMMKGKDIETFPRADRDAVFGNKPHGIWLLGEAKGDPRAEKGKER